MRPTHVAVIINPLSGAGDDVDGAARERAAIARATLASCGVEGEVAVSEWAGHALQLAHRFKDAGVPLILAWGGDGTINEVGSVLALSETALGIVRAGTGNGLARALKIPSDAVAAIAQALDAPERRIDVGQLGERYFFNVAGFGLDARVAHRFNSRPVGHRSFRAYLSAAIVERFTSYPLDYSVEVDGRMHRIRAWVITIANSSEYGSGAVIAPTARVDDGFLDLVAVEPLWLGADIRRALGLMRGVGPGYGVKDWRFREVTVGSDAAMWMHVDGEAFQHSGPVRVRVLPGSLKVRIAGSSVDND